MARRSIDTLIKSQIRGDLDRLRAKAKTENLKIKLAAIPATLTLEPSEPFDVAYMRRIRSRFRAGQGRVPVVKR